MDKQLITEFQKLYFGKRQIARRVYDKKRLEEVWAEIEKERKHQAKYVKELNDNNYNIYYNITEDVVENIDYINRDIEYEMIKYISNKNREKIITNAQLIEVNSNVMINSSNLKAGKLEKQAGKGNNHNLDRMDNIIGKLLNILNDSIHVDLKLDENFINRIYSTLNECMDKTKERENGELNSEIKSRVRSLIKCLESIDGHSPIITAAIIQFYIIDTEMFDKYSGAIARVISYCYLIDNGYKVLKYTTPSQIMLKENRKYCVAIENSQINQGDITYFVKYYSKVIRDSLEEFNKEVANKYGKKIIKELIDKTGVELEDRQIKFINSIVSSGEGVVGICDYKEKTKVSYETARGDLNYLVTLGFFKIGKSGKKYEYYFNNISTIVESFEE